jgi:hypothetical protein
MKFMRVHFGPSGPVIFLMMSSEFGKRMRGMLGMVNRQSVYYDPESAGMCCVPITIVIYFIILIKSATINQEYPASYTI